MFVLRKSASVLILVMVTMFFGAGCAKMEDIEDQASTDPLENPRPEPVQVYLPTGAVLKFKNEFSQLYRVDPLKTVRIDLDYKNITKFRFKQISLAENCGDYSVSQYEDETENPYFDFVPANNGRFVICAIGYLENTATWLSTSNAVFSKVLTVDSEPPTQFCVGWDRNCIPRDNGSPIGVPPLKVTRTNEHTAFFASVGATQMAHSLESCELANIFLPYTDRLNFTLPNNVTSTIYVKFMDDLENETDCVTASIQHDDVSPQNPQLIAPILEQAGEPVVFSRLNVSLDFEISCEVGAVLNIVGIINVKDFICPVGGKYSENISVHRLEEGINQIQIYQVDQAGNSSGTASYSLIYSNVALGFSLPQVDQDFEPNNVVHEISVPVVAAEVSSLPREVEFSIEADGASGTNYASLFEYEDLGVVKAPTASISYGKVIVPANSNSASIKIKWLGTAPTLKIYQLRVVLTGKQRRSERFVTDLRFKSSTAEKIRSLHVGERALCARFVGSEKVACMGRSDGRQILDYATNVDLQRTDIGINFLRSDVFPSDTAGIKEIAVGSVLTCMINQSDVLKCRGVVAGESNDTTNINTIYTTGIGTPSKLTVGLGHFCVVATSKLYCWGKAGDGQLGGQSSSPSLAVGRTPVNFGTDHDVLEAAAGHFHTCALLKHKVTGVNSVRCFGNNILGQLGAGNMLSKGKIAGDMPSLPDVKFKSGVQPVAIKAGGNHTCALLSDKSMSCWGSNAYGQLGTNDVVNHGSLPYAFLSSVDLRSLSGVEQMALGNNHTCALLEDKSIKCWGDNSYLQVGFNQFYDQMNADGKLKMESLNIPNPSDVTSLHAAGNYTCVFYSNIGDARCWGENQSGQRGKPYFNSYNAAQSAFGSTVYKEVSSAFNHTCAIDHDGNLDCWGLSAGGLLGDASNSFRYLPIGNSTNTKFKKVSAGTTVSCAQAIDDKLYCWGLNISKQLGAEMDDEYVTTPVPVATSLVFTQFVVGAEHVCGLTSDGSVYCWGGNSKGQLGVGDTNIRGVPTLVPGLAGVTKLSTGLETTCAILNFEREAKCWGRNSSNVISTDATAFYASPQSVVNLGGASTNFIKEIKVMVGNICYVMGTYTDGAARSTFSNTSLTARCRGANSFTQVSYGDPHYDLITTWNVPDAISSNYPYQVEVGLTFICYVQVTSAILDRTAGGSLMCRGDNSGGYLGAASVSGYSGYQLEVKFVTNSVYANPGSLKVAKVSVSPTHGCAIERYLEAPSGLYKDGRLFCWGNNKTGQLGALEMSAFHQAKTSILKHLTSR